MERRKERARRGQPQFYSEVKSASVFLMMTPAGLLALDRKIHLYDSDLSRSEFLERLARGTLDPARLVQVFFTDSSLAE